jgi:DNA mismatch repair protein MutL
MSIIKLLSENLINQIAAGEVVERPSSVVKELVENSLDAGADNIVVEVKESGKRLIKVTDNGKGMSADDLEMALERHATSKISSEDDLWKIRSMGFRGEALASISSVSRLSIRSRRADDISGRELNCEGGDIVTMKDVGMPVGTQVEVCDLFFNTPARQKYLKKEGTELSNISSTLNAVALANPGIAFRLIHNGKLVFDLPKVTDFISRISDVFGNATADAMLPVFYGGGTLKMDGFIGKPVISRSTSKYQYFFVNGRPVYHGLFANMIKSAYHSMLMENKKPVFLININIDPALIDVNVHPRKLEIRFENQQEILKIIYGMVKVALEKNNLTPKGFTESRSYMSDKFPQREAMGVAAPRSSFATGGEFRAKPNMVNVQEAIDFSRNFIGERDNEKKVSMISISQVANSYIVAQNEEGLVLIDQHAAHERVHYEQLMDQFENQEKVVQPLLIPLSIEFSHDEAQLVEENMEVFNGLGFEIEPFGGKTYVVNAVPRFLAKEDLDVVILGVVDDILNEKNASKLHGRTEDIINYMACRSAIKFGQKLSIGEMQALIEQMDGLKRPYTCPHGRPSMVSLSLGELEKMFGRK